MFASQPDGTTLTGGRTLTNTDRRQQTSELLPTPSAPIGVRRTSGSGLPDQACELTPFGILSLVAVSTQSAVEEIFAIDDAYRHELIWGVHHVSTSPGGPHQRIVIRLALALTSSCPQDLFVLPGPFGWIIRTPDGEEHGVQPDLVVLTDEQSRRRRLQDELPLLAVEVLSPGAANRARDLEDKFSLYQAARLPAYWAIDPDVPSLREWRLDGARLKLRKEVEGDQLLETDRPWPLSLRPADLS
jgi:Uma2 family endonuclease